MIFRSLSLTIFVIVLALSGEGGCHAQQPADHVADFRQLLQKIAVHSPDPCGEAEQSWDSGGVESSLFSHAADAVVRSLNAASSTPKSPHDRATDALKVLKQMSAETNVTWPDENRFHFEVFDFTPVMVIKMSIRAQARFFLFGAPRFQDGKRNQLWKQVWADPHSPTDEASQESVDIYPLHRGPAGNVRFLVHVDYSGCAGSVGVGYEGYEWDGESESATEILEQKGAFGLDSPKAFPQIGKLRTAGPLVTLPYCWFSAIDWWDNPSLCAVDTYDLSGDEVKFHSRIFNRPDLVPIAKAVEYAEKHDYLAVRGYCASDSVARRLVEKVPDTSGADDPKVTRTGAGRERVVFNDDPRDYFDVEKRAAGWVVTAFRLE
jgi:hypothetical protein